jgi:hypothetical protein
MLAFTSVYFLESGLFNGLRPFGVKNFPPFSLDPAKVVLSRFPTAFRLRTLPRLSFAQRKTITYVFDFCKRLSRAVMALFVGWMSSRMERTLGVAGLGLPACRRAKCPTNPPAPTHPTFRHKPAAARARPRGAAVWPWRRNPSRAARAPARSGASARGGSRL